MDKPQHSSALQLAARFEEIVLCLLLTTMIVLACLQIVLRSVFSSGLIWADPMLRYLVLWSGLLGASMATSKGKHIALDLAGYLIPERLRPLVQFLCYLFSAITSGFLTWAALLFIQSEMEFGSPGILGIPTWGWNLIFPLAFSVITTRYIILLITAAVQLLGKKSDKEIKQS